MTAVAVAGCGSSTAGHTPTASPPPATTAQAQAHPHVVEPVAGQGAARATPQVAQAGEAKQPLHDPVPTVAASDTSAVAKGAPTDAEVRAAIAKFQLAVATYHLDRLKLNYALLDPSQLPPGAWNVSIASVFTDYGLPIACGGVLHVPELGVANKTLPCGTQILFQYNGRAVKVPVLDRGPYIAGREWDLTGATAEALHFPGLGPIQWRIVAGG